MSPNILDHNSVTTEYDEFQRKAILSNSYISLINAGAGSGKTLTIIARLIYLMADQNVDPDEILVLVFNADVAREIRTRLRSIADEFSKCERLLIDYPNLDKKIRKISLEKAKEKKVHTFHSFSNFVIHSINKKFIPII